MVEIPECECDGYGGGDERLRGTGKDGRLGGGGAVISGDRRRGGGEVRRGGDT